MRLKEIEESRIRLQITKSGWKIDEKKEGNKISGIN